MLNSLVLPGNWSSAVEMWQGHCIAQRACIHTGRIPACPWGKQCTTLRIPPWASAKSLIGGPQ